MYAIVPKGKKESHLLGLPELLDEREEDGLLPPLLGGDLDRRRGGGDLHDTRAVHGSTMCQGCETAPHANASKKPSEEKSFVLWLGLIKI